MARHNSTNNYNLNNYLATPDDRHDNNDDNLSDYNNNTEQLVPSHINNDNYNPDRRIEQSSNLYSNTNDIQHENELCNTTSNDFADISWLQTKDLQLEIYNLIKSLSQDYEMSQNNNIQEHMIREPELVMLNEHTSNNENVKINGEDLWNSLKQQHQQEIYNNNSNLYATPKKKIINSSSSPLNENISHDPLDNNRIGHIDQKVYDQQFNSNEEDLNLDSNSSKFDKDKIIQVLNNSLSAISHLSLHAQLNILENKQLLNEINKSIEQNLASPPDFSQFSTGPSSSPNNLINTPNISSNFVSPNGKLSTIEQQHTSKSLDTSPNRVHKHSPTRTVSLTRTPQSTTKQFPKTQGYIGNNTAKFTNIFKVDRDRSSTTTNNIQKSFNTVESPVFSTTQFSNTITNSGSKNLTTPSTKTVTSTSTMVTTNNSMGLTNKHSPTINNYKFIPNSNIKQKNPNSMQAAYSSYKNYNFKNSNMSGAASDNITTPTKLNPFVSPPYRANDQKSNKKGGHPSKYQVYRFVDDTQKSKK